jgi:hypothetical protein
MKPWHAVAVMLALTVAPARAEEPPRTYALVSAIGSTLLYVKPRMSTGTHLEAFQRAELAVPDSSLDAAALRGLEKTVRLSDPTAKFVYLRLNPEEFSRIDAPQKGAVAVGKLATAFDRMPERKDWYQILVVTPRYVASERAGLGSKLSGVGIYVQPMERGVIGQNGGIDTDIHDDQPGEDAVTPDGKPVQSGSFIAPFFYTQVWVLDAATLQVIHTTERFDFQRIRDPSVGATKIENEVPPEKLGPIVETFVEQASARAAQEAIGVVTVGEPKVVRPR